VGVASLNGDPLPLVPLLAHRKRWLIVVLLAGFSVMNYIDRQALSVLAPPTWLPRKWRRRCLRPGVAATRLVSAAGCSGFPGPRLRPASAIHA